MDDVPYEFIERVFAKLSRPTIHRMVVRAPLWQEVARVQKRKLERYKCVILPSQNGLFYGFERCGTMTIEKALTFQEFAKLDWRYHQVMGFNVNPLFKSAPLEFIRVHLHPVGDRLAEIVEFVSQFNLECITVAHDPHQPQEDLLRRVLEVCCEHDWQTEKLYIHSTQHYTTQNFLLKLLNVDRLEALHLFGHLWDERLRSHLEAFVLRPNFKELYCGQFQCFDLEGIERIMAYWRSMEVRGRRRA